MKVSGTSFSISMTRGDKADTMHLEIGGLSVKFNSWNDLSQDGHAFLSLKMDGKSIADIQGANAIAVSEALDNYGMR